MSDRPGRPRLPGSRWLFLFLGGLGLLLLSRWGTSLYVDHLWYAAEGRSGVYWTRVLSEAGLRAAAALITGGFLYLALGPVARAFAHLRIRRKLGDLVIQERLPARYLRWGRLGISALVAFWVTAALPSGVGLQLLLALRAPATGVVDPVLEADLAFHLFRLPALVGVLGWAMVVGFLALALAVAGYTASGALESARGRVSVSPEAAGHLAWLVALLLFLASLRLVLAPWGVLVEGTSGVQGIVGEAQISARIPALRLVAFLAFVTAVGAGWGALRQRLLPAVAGAGALAVIGVAVAELYPAAVQRFQVQPNELARESLHIERAVQATRSGFGMAELDRTRYPYQPPTRADWDQALDRMARLPVWTEKTLLQSLQQVEARFPYYTFGHVTFDRYVAGDSVLPAVVAVREVAASGIPLEGRNWQNLHLRERYVTGQGVVAGPSNRQDPEGRMPTWIAALPPEFRGGSDVPDRLRMTRPQVHVGSRPQAYAIVTPTEEAFRAPDGTPGVAGRDFPEGIRVGGFFRRAVLAWYFQDLDLLLSDEVGADSRLVFRRDAQSRVRALAPFLHLPQSPQAVLHEGRLVWIVEGYTVSRRYPLSVPHEVSPRLRVNWLRNGVKATVDAVTGEVRLFAADAGDLVLRGWMELFPGLVEPLDALDPGLADHLRYPDWYMERQSRVLLRFHQDAPAVFHGQQDRWAIPTETPDAQGEVPYRPEHALLTLPGEETPSWTLATALVPASRPNLAALLTGRWIPGQGLDLRLWDLPVEDQVAGPRQVAVLVEQDAAISEQFSLWRRAGSDVSTGHLHIVPVGSTLLYMEPVFLAAESDAIPEIRRYIVSDGRRVAMEPTLSGAVERLRLIAAGLPAPLPSEADTLSTEPGAPLPGLPPALVDLEGLPAADARRALELLESAEERLRAGDWDGFGRGLEALRTFLDTRARGGAGIPPP
jgi:uncharacterized protein